MNAIPPNNDRRSRLIGGALAVALGLFMVLLSQGVIEGHTGSRRSALFNDPRNWQLAAFGLMFALAGVALLIPPRFEALLRFNAMSLILAMMFAGGGSIWYGSGGRTLQKGGSMTAFLDSIAKWFQSVGVHPVLGAFLAGVVIAFVFAYRRSPSVELPPGGPAARPMFTDGGSAASPVAGTKLNINGRSVGFSPEVMAYIRADKKIEAIKALRHSSGLDLKSAKDAVEAMAESPGMRQ